jgi:hypothetical protein
MRRPFLAITTVVLCGGLASCLFPTEVCGCSPALGELFIRGQVIDGRGLPVAGARVYGDGVPPRVASDSVLGRGRIGELRFVTDAQGRFAGTVFSYGGPGTMVLRTAVSRPPDTTQFRTTQLTATFRHRAAPDTISLILQVP